jgi:small conductance mechanosensitive channel
MEDQIQAIDQVRTLVIDMGLKFGPKVLVAVLMLLAGYACGRWVGGIAARALHRLQLEPPVHSLVIRTIRVLVLGLFAIMALQNLGVELLPLIAGLGVIGAGIALAMQGVLGNVAAGLTIIFTRPFRVGDYVSIASEEGVVLEISILSTVLGHADLSRVVIPNRKIAGEILHNYGRIRQLGIEIRVSLENNLEYVLSVIREVLKANVRVLQDPPPVVNVRRLSDASAVIGICPWVGVTDYGPAAGEICLGVVEAFRLRGIEIPAPLREVRVLSQDTRDLGLARSLRLGVDSGSG